MVLYFFPAVGTGRSHAEQLAAHGHMRHPGRAATLLLLPYRCCKKSGLGIDHFHSTSNKMNGESKSLDIPYMPAELSSSEIL